MATQQADVAFGSQSEDALLATLDSCFGGRLQRTEPYHPMDFANSSKTVYVELKTRRIKHNAYPTALIGWNKVQFCSDPTKDYYFVYRYTDGLFYIKYSKEEFGTFRTEWNYVRGERVDCVNPASSVVHIPVEKLKPVGL
jgi:hypothetical protein